MLTSRLPISAVAAASVTLSLLGMQGCQTIREIRALERVDFALDRVSRMTLAGVDLTGVGSYTDLAFLDVGKIGAGLAAGSLPLDFDLHIAARNPPENAVQARLIAMDWTVLLQGRDAVSGSIDREVILPPGETRDVTITVGLDLLEFVEGNAVDLVELALAIAGKEGGKPKEITVRARPTISTAIGPIRYPGEITIVSETVGG